MEQVRKDESRLLGLGIGADDYITKQFLPKELVLRLKAILKRTYLNVPGNSEAQSDEKPVITLGNIKIDMNSGTVKNNNKETTLTAKEYVLLSKLYSNKGSIVTIDALCRACLLYTSSKNEPAIEITRAIIWFTNWNDKIICKRNNVTLINKV